MGGIRHSLWGMPPGHGSEPHKPTGDYQADNLEWQKKLATNHPTMCALCGQQILQTDQDAEGKHVNWAMEMKMGMHYKCYTEEMMKRRAEQQRGNQP